MKQCRIVSSNDAPALRDCIWAKPVTGGFSIYLLEGGVWLPVITVDDNDTPDTADDIAVKIKKKADKVVGATSNNLAALTNTGNIKDSGISIASIGGGIIYKGVVNADADLPTDLTSDDNGAQYIVGTAGIYQSESLIAGDYLIWNGAASSWDIIKK